MPVRLPESALSSASLFNPLRSLRPMPSMRPFPTLLRAAGPRVSPPANLAVISDLPVAVFDGGVDVTSPYYSVVTNVDLTSEAAELEASRHGSGVVGGILYGNIQPGSVLGQPVASVQHFRVVPHPNPTTDPDAYWILDQIVARINAGNFKIVHLSLGPNLCVEPDSEPNRWTATLDALAYEKGVLFVTAAGNNGEEDSATGLDRVMVPADMVNGLSVGACDALPSTTPWNRTAYSAIGPGRPGALVQPCGVQFGGDVGTAPFHALQADGTLVPTSGTSFAAPLVTSGILRLGGELGNECSVQNTLRAFSLHMAEVHPTGEAALNHVGYGRLPLDYNLACGPNEVTVLYQDTIGRDEIIGLPLPLPDSALTGTIEIRWTLVITAPTEPTESTEYTRATIEPVFRPHANRYRFTHRTAGPEIADVVQDYERVSELLRAGYQVSAVPVSKAIGPGLPDEVDRRDGGKWETVRRGEVRMRASSLRMPRLDLTYLARQGGLLDRASSELDYSLLVTVRARPDVPLYDKVRLAFQPLTPLRTRVAQRIRS